MAVFWPTNKIVKDEDDVYCSAVDTADFQKFMKSKEEVDLKKVLLSYLYDFADVFSPEVAKELSPLRFG